MSAKKDLSIPKPQDAPMSISLVVVRLEIEDKAELPKDLWYSAENFDAALSEESKSAKLTYAQAASIKPCSEDTGSKFRGRREPRTIIIETHVNEVPMEMSESKDLLLTLGEGKGESDMSGGLEEGAAILDGSHDDVHAKEASPAYSDTSSATIASNSSEAASENSKKMVPGPSRTRKSPVSSYASVTASESRFSPIESRQSSVTSDDGISSRPGSGSARLKSHSPTMKEPPAVHFFSGNPMVETTEGIMHLYKDNQETSLSPDVARSDMVCILAVPASMNSQDLLQFTASVAPGIEHMRIIRDATPSQYMVLIKFRNQKTADEFYKVYNNMPFNSIEPEICHLVYVARVEAIKASEGASLPVLGLTELPKCTICLERMDESVDGILTILCNHSFHGSCLYKWGDTSCPVCRYVQTPEQVADNQCFQCGAQDSLWICLICGHVGCGRYVQGHAYRHFQDTQHCYSMQLGNNRVWDYAGDNYVHRLIQNKGDGKLVEVDEGGNMVQEEKIDSITLECTYLLTSQLESQRAFFEEKIALIEKESEEQREELEARAKKSLSSCEELERRLEELKKERQAQERKSTLMQSRLTKAITQLQEEKELNSHLRQNQKQWSEKVVSLEKELHATMEVKNKEIKDLQEQLRDVMFYFKAQEQLTSTNTVSQAEIQEGQIVVGESPPHAGPKRRHKKGGR